MLLLLACCESSSVQEKFNYEIIVLTYPQRTLSCADYSWHDCGLTLYRCVEKDTEEYYDWIKCVPAMIRRIK